MLDYSFCQVLVKQFVLTVTFRDLTLLDIANLCPAVLIMNFLFV